MPSGIRPVTSFICLTALLIVCGCGKSPDPNGAVTLKLAHGLDPAHPVHRAMEVLAEKAAEYSNGRLKIEIHPSEQLGNERECLEQVQLGSLAMTKSSAAPLEAFVPQLSVLGLPYLFRDDDHMWKVLGGAIGKRLLAAGENRQLKGLCFYDAGARSFYTTGTPILAPRDLAGKKIRVMQSQMCMNMVSAMGGAPTPIGWGELYTSLQQGVVDGAENNPPSFYTSKHYEVCKHYSLDQHLRIPDVLIISTKVWNNLAPDLQAALQKAVDESVEVQRRLWAESVKESLAAVEKAGVTIHHPDIAPFRAAVQPVWDEYLKSEYGELAREIQAVE